MIMRVLVELSEPFVVYTTLLQAFAGGSEVLLVSCGESTATVYHPSSGGRVPRPSCAWGPDSRAVNPAVVHCWGRGGVQGRGKASFALSAHSPDAEVAFLLVCAARPCRLCS